MPFYEAIHDSKITHILARNERCAAHMADGYARSTNEIGVCDAPGGMGTPFLCPALLEAYNSSSPILAIASSTPLKERGKWVTGELDQSRLFSAITKKMFLLSNKSKVCLVTNKAIATTKERRPGPVLLEVTYDLFRKKTFFKDYPTDSGFVGSCSIIQLKKALSAIVSAERPIIFAGGGVFLSNAYLEVLQIAEKLGIPIATTLTGKGVIPETHPLSLGVAGAKGRNYVNEYVSGSDCILVLGSKLGEKATNYGTLFNKKSRVIRVDIDYGELKKNVAPFVALCGDLKEVLGKFLFLINRLETSGKIKDFYSMKKNWLREFEISCDYTGEKIKPQLIIKELAKITPQNNIVVADGSTASGWTGVYWNTTAVGRRFIASRGTGMIGFALPAAIGAKLGSPKEKLISLTGDSGFMFSAAELETAHRYNVSFVQIIINNNSLGLLKQYQAYVYGRIVLPDFSNIDFCKLAEAMHVKSLKIEKKSELKEGLTYALNLDEPIVLDVVVDKAELSPDFKNTLIRKKISF